MRQPLGIPPETTSYIRRAFSTVNGSFPILSAELGWDKLQLIDYAFSLISSQWR